MTRSQVVRLQLLLLTVLAVLLVGRGLFHRISGPVGLVIDTIEPYDMEHVSFEVDVPTQVEIGAAGSLESNRADAQLAAYAWLVCRDNLSLVWRQSGPTSGARDGTLVREQSEAVLSPGTYDLYFAAYGRDMSSGRRGGGFLFRLFTRQPGWEKDQKHWQVSIQPVGDQGGRLREVDSGEAAIEGAHVVWSAVPMGDRDSARLLFEVLEPVDLRVVSIGEIQPNGKDYGWIDDLTRRRRVWELGPDNTTEAGGHAANRMFDGLLSLEPGVFVASFETDAGHAYPQWRAAPPYLPRLWGLTLMTEDALAERIRAFDPWQDREPLLELSRVGSSRHETVSFNVARPMGVLIAALGEMRPQDRLDYGWIEDSSGARLWEMRHEESGHAGGAERNRELQQFLSLAPGEYMAHYRTDDSHAYGDWRSDPPRKPEHWGMTIFPIDKTPPSNRFRILSRVTDDPAEPPDPPQPPMLPVHPHGPNRMIAQIGPVGNDQNFRQGFELTTPSVVTIHAQGELLPHERYDYGWIERAESGQTVWEMTWANTEPAGADQRNRRFEGTVRLDSGRYVVRFKSDPSHAVGDFGKIAPENPTFWGISISVAP